MKRMLAKAVMLIWAAGVCQGQAPGGGTSSQSRAAQLPLQGGEAGNGAVAAQPGVIQVSGAYAGSVAGGAVPAGAIRLTVADAVKRGLATNLGPISANDSARAARDERLQALSALLPNIAANASDTVTQVNLAAYGFQFHIPASVGFSIPTVVGPYNYSSLQGTLSQSVFDMVQRRNWQAAKEQERAAVFSAKDAREMVVLAVGGTYLQTLSTAARVASQQAQVDNARAIYNQAQVRKSAGTNARIDVTRSLVELQMEQQRLSSLNADYRKQVIALARIIGLPQDREIVLTDALDSGGHGITGYAAIHSSGVHASSRSGGNGARRLGRLNGRCRRRVPNGCLRLRSMATMV